MESHIRYIQLNPAQFVVSSFFCLILVGTILLKLPYSTTNGIAFIDALFTATSAVCITGLVVVDTGTCFTFSGQIIIMLLMQSGALGILTFATYFSYFVKGGSSYSTQITMSSISNSEKVDDVFKILKRILYITIGIESVGAICIYFSLNSILIPSITDRLFFSAFHAVSAFCNAGFSTLKNGIMETGYVTNYLFQLSLFFLFFTGSLGFPIVTNLLKYLKHVISSTFSRVIYKKRDVYKPRIMTLNSRINLITTFLLTIVGVCFFFISEYDNVLLYHDTIGKFITAFFSSSVSRSAGFNTVDYSQLHIPTILFIILFMWIGGSPVSTGGGIKTSTFAIAVLNFISIVRGKKTIEVFNREISENSIRKAFATIILSFFSIGVGAFFISIFDKDISILKIVFECVSAYGTVGLSLGITPELSIVGKAIICLLMFIGRITLLTVLIAFIKQAKQLNYSYPSEEILIN